MPIQPSKAQPLTNRNTRWWPLLGIFVLALGLRLAYMAQTMHGPLFECFQTDARWHAEWATQIAEGRWHPDRPLFRAPLYPLFLAGIRLVTGEGFLWARIVQHVLGALSCVMVALLGARAFSERVGWVAGTVWRVICPADLLRERTADPVAGANDPPGNAACGRGGGTQASVVQMGGGGTAAWRLCHRATDFSRTGPRDRNSGG